jgi:large subunit ribosomal protein L10
VIRADKVKLVESMAEAFTKTPHVFLATFSGLKVNQVNELRSQVREAGGRYTVIKNRLAKRAAKGTPMELLAEHLTGPCALATHDSDPVLLAKVISEFNKQNPELEVLAGLLDGKEVLDQAGVKQLATLPGLPELRAQILALLQTPATSLVRLLGTPQTQLARSIDARREKLEKTEG